MAKKNTTGAKSSDIAAALGELSKKVTSWKEQRAAMIRELRRLSELTDAMRRELGDAAPAAPPAARRGGRPRGYRTSAATRAKLRAAWKRRKDRAAAAAGKPAKPAAKRQLSAEARARIAEAQRKRWAAARAARK
jgi:hypothetical protein